MKFRWFATFVVLFGLAAALVAQENGSECGSEQVSLPTLEELKSVGARSSSYRNQEFRTPQSLGNAAGPREANVEAFRKSVAPILEQACVECHGADTQEGNVRIDTLDPDLFHGDEVDWWLEVLAVLTNGEMPPPDEGELADEDRAAVISWLAAEMQFASSARREQKGRSSFRRMTRYEYKYALQDLLGRPYDFAKDLPPEPTSEDGFQNSSDMLHMSVVQFETYRESALKALNRVTVAGEQPAPIYWGVSMKAAAEVAFRKQDEQLKKINEQHKGDPEKLERELERHAERSRERPSRNTHYRDPETGAYARSHWSYGGAKYAWKPNSELPNVPEVSEHVVVIPRKQNLIVELGDTIPDEGTLRVRVRASRVDAPDALGKRDASGTSEEPHEPAAESLHPSLYPSLQLEFGWQASNDSSVSVKISEEDLVIDAESSRPKFYEWELPLGEIYPRNSVRNISKMGDLPSPSEYVKLVNSSVSQGDIQIDYVEVSAHVYEQWPPSSHSRLFFDSENKADETTYARELLTSFMKRAWRREVTAAEVDQKVALFESMRPTCSDFEQAMVEVLATVLSSPKFLYLIQAEPTDSKTEGEKRSRSGELATRLSMFLWSSVPDEELLSLASDGRLSATDVLGSQVERMLADPRTRRLSEQFMRQWLGMQLLDFLDVDRKAYPQFDSSLKEAMQKEPIAFFHDNLRNNRSVMEFIHTEHTMANERLAKHYDLKGIYGNHLRRVSLQPDRQPDRSRGGLLTQAGLLAMNSDGKDSHPLKRGIWLLENLLNDPPPPPPPAVPEIDLADPEIAKLTLKERIEDHRNDAACMSCHAKIDPWGIAFESFDAVGKWRTEVQGKPVDASSRLFNGQELDGMEGLKRFLLEHRQDQFVRAMVYKMTAYALGRPLTFADRSSIERITADVRKQGDGLATMVQAIVASDLFRGE